MSSSFLQWDELPWISRGDVSGDTVLQCDRLFRRALNAETALEFLTSEVPALGTHFAAQWVGLCERTPTWEIVTETGRNPLGELPTGLMQDCMENDSCGHGPAEKGFDVLVAPLTQTTHKNLAVVLIGKNLERERLPHLTAVSRAFGYSLELCNQISEESRQRQRLRTLLDVASRFAEESETVPLLERIAEDTTRLMECDRASIFLWDKENQQLVACPALGVEGRTLRLPDSTGIVGTVIHHNTTIQVDDAYNDDRFNRDVDRESGYHTRNLLAVPLRDPLGKVIGAFEVINKNEGLFDSEDQLLLEQLGVQVAIAVQNTQEREQLIRSRDNLTQQVTKGVNIIGESPVIDALRETIKQVANTMLPVLILGESGTGKEVFSQALHYQGPRADHPFVAVNCAALTETLLESELFGHERGAFTDAHETRLGKFELADGGTLFLDEMGEMSPGGQAKLLRVLEQKVITRVGGSQSIPVNVRVVAATNVNLAEAVRQKRFRDDLYYRLGVMTLQLPSLRERPEDILPLAEHFLKEFCRQANRKPLAISAEARRHIQAHPWPGNVRELRNLMERVAFLAQGEKVEKDDLAFIIAPEAGTYDEPSFDMPLKEATEEFQREYISKSIKRVKGNMSEAAKLLGLHRANLYRKLRQLDMNDDTK